MTRKEAFSVQLNGNDADNKALSVHQLTLFSVKRVEGAIICIDRHENYGTKDSFNNNREEFSW